jgi:hypothetical protein
MLTRDKRFSQRLLVILLSLGCDSVWSDSWLYFIPGDDDDGNNINSPISADLTLVFRVSLILV